MNNLVPAFVIWSLVLLAYLIGGEFANANEVVVDIIREEALAQGLDPEVALAVARIESSLNPKALGEMGEVGLFQIRPEFVSEYPKTALFDARLNARVGIQQLLYYKKTCFTTEANTFVVCYNGGLNRHPKYPKLLPYYKRFQNALSENRNASVR